MAATIEIKYFNSFWLKKMNNITQVSPTIGTGPLTVGASSTGDVFLKVLLINPIDLEKYGPGQQISWTYTSIVSTNVIANITSDATYTYFKLLNPLTTDIGSGVVLEFGKIIDYNFLPGRYLSAGNFSYLHDWYIEEARIRGGYNNTSVDFGVKAYIVEDSPQRQHLFNTMIYSGVFNSRTGINNTNQFSVAEDITRTIDPSQGSIQKLYAEDTNLIIFQELKVSRALIDKDAVYSADGSPMTTSGSQVIGQIQSYAGNYGIGTHPESFAVYGYRKYFVDGFQNVVLRLSQDGITEISAYGMFDYFRDKLSNTNLTNGFIYGLWDIHSKQYVVSIQPTISDLDNIFYIDEPNSVTLSFDEDNTGWTSLHSYIPNQGVSLRNNFYTFKNGSIWKHYSTAVQKASYYNFHYPSKVTVIFNPSVSQSKSFLTVNYEGTSNWSLSEFYTETDITAPVDQSFTASTLIGLQDQLFENRFKKKENKYFANLLNISSSSEAEVVWGQSISGVKGFYATATFYCANATVDVNLNQKAELFAVSAEYVESSY
jgi:hypothetical protein